MPLYQSLYERLGSQHESIGVVIAKAGESRLRSRPLPDKWSGAEIIAHLLSYQEHFTERVKTILRVDHPRFERYVAENDPLFRQLCETDIPSLLIRLNEQRQELFRLITQLPESELIRGAGHPRYGNLDIPQWTEFFLLHEAHHVFALFRLVHDTTPVM